MNFITAVGIYNSVSVAHDPTMQYNNICGNNIWSITNTSDK